MILTLKKNSKLQAQHYLKSKKSMGIINKMIEKQKKSIQLLKEGNYVELIKHSLNLGNFDNNFWFGKKDNTDVENFIKNTKDRVKIVDTSIIKELISKNESTIIDFDKDKLHDLVRLSNFVQNLESSIKRKFEHQDISSRVLAIIELEKNTEHLDLIIKLSVTMLNKIIEGKITDFLIIYEKFEDIGVFRSSFEHELLSKFDRLSNQLDEISGKLSNISSKLGYQNLLLTYNTYQFSKFLKK